MFELAQKRIARLSRWDNSFIKLLGLIEILMGIMLLVPSILALYYKEDPLVFFYLVPVFLVLGISQFILFRSDTNMSATTGIVLISVTWFIAFFVSSVPFFLYGYSFVDSIFEGISGFTTTGATIVTDVEALPYSLLLWRSLTQWVGGIAVVLVFIFLLPMMGIGGRAFYNNELSGSETDNFSMRMKNVASNFILVYIFLTAVEAILLFICGIDIFECVCITMSTISTGGMMVHGDSMASYSTIVQGIVLFFMFMGGTNFYLHFRAIMKRDVKAYAKSQEFIWTIMWFLIIIAMASVIILNYNADYIVLTTDNTLDTIWEAAFTVVSIGTSSGFSVSDYTIWPSAALLLLWILAMFGAMSGSTAGGIKMYRIMMIASYIKIGMGRFLHPNMVKEITLNDQPVSKDSVTSAIVVTLLFLITGLLTSFLLFLTEPVMDLMTAFGLSVASLGNLGLGFGAYGPLGSFAELTDLSKLLLAFMMWVGRLEIILALIIFTKTFWMEFIRNFHMSSIKPNNETFLTRTLRYRKK